MDDPSARADARITRRLVRLLALTAVGLLAISSRPRIRTGARPAAAKSESGPAPVAVTVPTTHPATVQRAASRISFFDEVLTENLPPRRRSRLW